MLRRAVAASLLVLVAGCSSDPAPKEPASPTKSATPTIAAPTMPAQAKENTPEGASAFVDYYIDVLNFAANTGDVKDLSRLSDPKCTGCQKYIKLYRETYIGGGRFTGGEWSPGRMIVDFGEPETYVTTTIAIAVGEVQVGPDRPAEPESASKSKVSFAISGKPWLVTQFGPGETK